MGGWGEELCLSRGETEVQNLTELIVSDFGTGLTLAGSIIHASWASKKEAAYGWVINWYLPLGIGKSYIWIYELKDKIAKGGYNFILASWGWKDSQGDDV